MGRRTWAAAIALMGGAAAVSQRWLTAQLRAAEDATRIARAHQRALRAVVEAAGSATMADVQGVLDTVTTATAQLGSDMSGLYRLGDDGLLRFVATYGIPEHLRDEAFPPGVGLAGSVVQLGQPIVTNDYRHYRDAVTPWTEVSLRAAIGAPIVVDDRVVGALVAGRTRPGGYDAAEITAFELLAVHAGRALALAELIDEDRRALAQLRRLHELQADFVATVSHELRTPLTIIDGVAETLAERGEALPVELRDELLRRLRANSTALTAIVTSLLESARLDRGLVEVDRAIVDVGAVARSCVDRLSPMLCDHELHTSIGSAHVLGDAALLDRVLENLLANVARHTPPGTRVDLTVMQVGRSCTVELTDDGPGIAAEDLEHVTQPFRRSGDHHTREGRGLGLGLALVAEVLRLHGTRLRVSSDPGRATTFGFSLPVVDEGWSTVPAARHDTAGHGSP